MAVLYKIWKKYNEIQLTKNEIDLNNQKILKIIHLGNTSGRGGI